ncbi:hypothetical protein A5906_26320 [Bradyrhizobium sacchari]|uniref:hypothetical protein n=1 Tax=Bradyrhizobium sacchari TaxID=1399419 RepID=UPI0009B0E277|nr:hypothetical protein [Bradyrhizobium sacchari]OPY99245.1 hypothetical protein A5906_26320 [Bradyrhizobium sacchari]
MAADAQQEQFIDLVRLQFSVATRLRLTPQSLLERKTAWKLAAERPINPVADLLDRLDADDKWRNGGAH